MAQSQPPPVAVKPMVEIKAKDGSVLSVPVMLNSEAFERGLRNHDDRDFVNYIVHSCHTGVNIGYEGVRQPIICENWPSATACTNAVMKSIADDLAKSRKLGPFVDPQAKFDNFVGSPMGAFPKKHSPDKYRVIYDLSYPPGKSVNDHIPSDKFSLTYMTIDDVVYALQQYGQGALMAKLDLESAFSHILVHPQDWELLGSSFWHTDSDGEAQKLYYINTVLPFGLRSSPKLFTDFAFAAKLIMEYDGVSYVNHYLDDYITLGPPKSDVCQSNLETMLNVCSEIGFSINPSKLVLPTTTIEFLGIILDSEKLELRISQARLDSIMNELEHWRHRKKATKREILSLLGKLIFISRVVRCSRTFVRRIIQLSKKVKHLHHSVRLNKQFQADILWWLTFLPSWNGVAMFYDHHWISSTAMDFYSDASNIAVAGYWQGDWFVELTDLTHSINWRELYAVVVAAATWAPQWSGRRIIFHCDNMSVVQVLASGTSKRPELMVLLRTLFYVAATYQFEFSSQYINTKVNCVADSLSRLDFYRFWHLVPGANFVMTRPAKLELEGV